MEHAYGLKILITAVPIQTMSSIFVNVNNFITFLMGEICYEDVVNCMIHGIIYSCSHWPS